jgi:hypothetical protein
VIDLLTAMGYRLYWHTPVISDPEVFGGVRYVSVNILALPVERGDDVEGQDPIDPANWTCPVILKPPSG